jgi:hypothetical protein
VIEIGRVGNLDEYEGPGGGSGTVVLAVVIMIALAGGLIGLLVYP